MNAYDTVIIGTANTMHRLAREHSAEIERYRERLGAVTMLLGCARTSLRQGHPIEAGEFIDLAERAARGGSNSSPMRTGPEWGPPERSASEPEDVNGANALLSS